MRITAVNAYIAPPPARSWLNQTRMATPMSVYPRFKERRSAWRGPNTQDVFVQVETDEGLTGLGITRGGSVVKAIIEDHLRIILVGSDPREVELLWDQMFRATLPYGRKGVPVMALSAVDLALWDLLAKWMGQPLYQVLGGAMRDSLPVYATHPDPASMASEGYVGAKIPMPCGPADGKAGLQTNLDHVAEVRQAIGPDLDLMVDCWMSWDLQYTLEFARAAEPYRLRWIEEPLPPDDYEGYSELRRRVTSTQIAAGEHEYTRWGFRELLSRGCVDVVQPDVAWSGGISEVRRVAAMAAAYNVLVVPHNGVMQPWATHLMLASPNCPLAEYVVFYGPNDQAPPPVMLGELHPDRGRVRPSDAPGVGVELDLDELKHQTATP